MYSAVIEYYSNAKHFEINNYLNVLGPNTEAILLIFVSICVVTLLWKFF